MIGLLGKWKVALVTWVVLIILILVMGTSDRIMRESFPHAVITVAIWAIFFDLFITLVRKILRRIFWGGSSAPSAENSPGLFPAVIAVGFFIFGFIQIVLTMREGRPQDAQAPVGFFFLPIYAVLLSAGIHAFSWAVAGIATVWQSLGQRSFAWRTSGRLMLAALILAAPGVGIKRYFQNNQIRRAAETSADAAELQRIFDGVKPKAPGARSKEELRVFAALLKNPHCSPEMIRSIWKAAPSLFQEIAEHPATPRDVLQEIGSGVASARRALEKLEKKEPSGLQTDLGSRRVLGYNNRARRGRPGQPHWLAMMTDKVTYKIGDKMTIRVLSADLNRDHFKIEVVPLSDMFWSSPGGRVSLDNPAFKSTSAGKLLELTPDQGIFEGDVEIPGEIDGVPLQGGGKGERAVLSYDGLELAIFVLL